MVQVKQDSLEAMADNIVAIAQSMRSINKSGGLTRDALVTLIHRDTGVFRASIDSVLDSLECLDQKFVRK